MKKYIVFIFILFNSLNSFSVGNSLDGPTTVDPGDYYYYRLSLDGWSAQTTVIWKITNGHFNNVNGKTEIRQTIAAGGTTVVWNDTTEKGIITISINGPVLLRTEVNINSVKNMYITDFRYDGNKPINDIISIPPDQTGVLVCTVPDMEYPISKHKINEFKWSTPKSWGGKIFNSSGTIRINYTANSGNNEIITVTPLGFGGVVGNTKTITIKRQIPLPTDGRITNTIIESRKFYTYDDIYVENVTIKDGAIVTMLGHESVRIMPNFRAELGSRLSISIGNQIVIPPKTFMNGSNSTRNQIVFDETFGKMEQSTFSSVKGSTVITYFVPNNTLSAYIQIYNTMGVLVMQIPIATIGKNNITIDTYKLTNGIYIYSLIADGYLIDTKKMIISN